MKDLLYFKPACAHTSRQLDKWFIGKRPASRMRIPLNNFYSRLDLRSLDVFRGRLKKIYASKAKVDALAGFTVSKQHVSWRLALENQSHTAKSQRVRLKSAT